MTLPGGLLVDGERRCDWAFGQVSGALELALAEIPEGSPNMPAAVTEALTLALVRLAAEVPSRERVAALCVADRQFLMRELDRHLGVAGEWLAGDCHACGERFDVYVDYAELPVQQAGPGYPLAQIEVYGQPLGLRLPTGADQHELADIPADEAPAWLLRRLTEAGDHKQIQVSPELIVAAEQALDAVAPGVVLEIQTRCPACDAANTLDLDPYRVLRHRPDGLLGEVHQVAWYYHWSEAEILALPRARRHRYLGFIDRSRGMTG